MFWIIFSFLSFFSIQYIPYMRGGIFWYTSVAHYVIPYGVALLCITAAIEYALMPAGQTNNTKRRQIKYLVLISMGMSYLGGAGYLTIVLSAESLMLLILLSMHRMKTAKRSHNQMTLMQAEKNMLLIIPLILLMAGFIVSAAAPGNKVRGGNQFGFHVSVIFMTLLKSIQQGITGSASEFIRVKPLILLVLIVPVAAVRLSDSAPVKKNQALSFSHPVFVTELCLLFCCSVYAPGIYANTGLSGGVPDTIYFVFLLMMVIWEIYFVKWLLIKWPSCRFIQIIAARGKQIVLAAFLLCILCSKHLVKNTVDYTCITFATSGHLADYSDQMEERIRLLTDPRNDDVIVPGMNNEQGPFMCMSIMDDPDNVINKDTALFYGKKSVTAVSREQYNNRINSSNSVTDK